MPRWLFLPAGLALALALAAVLAGPPWWRVLAVAAVVVAVGTVGMLVWPWLPRWCSRRPPT